MKRDVRQVQIEGDLAFVPLTRGYVAVIDAADAEIVGQHNWMAFVMTGRNMVYASTNIGGRKNHRTVLMHRLIAGEPKGLQVDHRDGDGLNNRRENLRAATHADNQRNSRTPVTNSSGFKGVSLCNGGPKWQARISVDNITRYLGVFETKEEAAEAYMKAAQRLHGEFANPG